MVESVSNTSFSGYGFRDSLSQEEYERRKETTERVATGTAATGTVAYGSKKYAGKYVRDMFENVTGTAKTVSKNAKEATTLLGKFKADTIKFSKDAMARLMKFKDSKYIGPIVKSKAVRGLTTGFGVVTAFFVLVTGIGEAIDNGRLAIGDAKRKFDMAA